jgi:23S rRNA (uracil1939-C5)-methyltransferase
VDAQLKLKEDVVVAALARRGVSHPALLPSMALPPWAYRTTIRGAVIDGRFGFHGARSHDIVDVAGCAVAHPLLAELIEHGRYRDATEVTLRCGARTGERLAATRPASVEIDVPDDARRTFIHEEAAGYTWQISADSFFQARPDGADALAQLILTAARALGQPGTAVDLYAGVGLFAGVLAKDGWNVTAVERARSSVADARVNVGPLGVRVVRADVSKFRSPRCDVVVADPSRDGLGRKGVDVVVRAGASRVVLVHCDVDALTRDAGLMHAAGYSLSSMRLVDLFPQTFHVEVVSVFDR